MQLLLLMSFIASAPPSYEGVRPLLETYCFKCHNADKKEGGTDLASLIAEVATTKPKLWKRTKGRVESGEMPPDGEKQLTPADKKKLLDWLGSASGFFDCDPAKRDPGPPQLRRLTRTEYDNTIRDLLGVPFNSAIAVGLPDDPAGEGHFDTLAANLRLLPVLMEKYFAAADKVIEKAFGTDYIGQRSRKLLFVAKPGPKLSETDAARQVVTTFARRAFRKQPDSDDVARLMGFYEKARAAGANFADGIRAVLKPVLVSPQFLFRLELDRPGTTVGIEVDDYELAVRLSYFLWSSMPDDELFRVAEEGKLRDGLDAQVLRMLKDSKAKALTDGFAAQWLHLDKLGAARPTTEFFPTFNNKLKEAMREEATLFFDHLRTDDRSVLELLDADYTFANAALAKHYGLAPVTGEKLVEVPLKPEDHRGGVLGMGAVLALTSHTFRTSPTQRGKYVLDVIFGTPPPPPPANAGTLKDDQPKGKKQPLTFKEQLAQHATQPSCAGCHKKIDPLGFALDNYNAVGAWREGTEQSPLDVAGVLPNGQKVDGAAGLKAVILSRKDDFARNLIAKVLEYALGRELDAFDDCTVNDIHAAMAKSGYKFGTLMSETVRSVPMRQRRSAKP